MEPRLPRLVFSPEALVHRRIEVLKLLNRNTRLLVPDQVWWSTNPLGVLWPEMGAALVTSNGGLPTVARWLVIIVAAE